MVSHRTHVYVYTTGCLAGVENLILLPFEPLQALEWTHVMKMKESRLMWRLWR